GNFIVKNLSSDVTLFVGGAEEFDLDAPQWVELQSAEADVNVELDSESNQWISLIVNGNEKTIGGTGGTLAVDGEGNLFYNNATSGKFATIDVSELDGKLDLAGMSASVQETVVLGAESGASHIHAVLGENSSTLKTT